MGNYYDDDAKSIQTQYDDITERGYVKDDIRTPPYRHEHFPPDVMALLEVISNALDEVYPLTIDQWEDGFRRDTNPEQEIAIWLHTVQVYKHITTKMLQNLHLSHRKTIFRLLVQCMNTSQRDSALQDAASMGIPDQIAEIVVSQFYGA
jgi:hypothetical protein